MLILADLGHDPKHWLSEAATAADQSDDRGALLAFGRRDGGRSIRGVWGAEPPQKAFLVSRHWWLGTKLSGTCHFHWWGSDPHNASLGWAQHLPML